MTCISLSCVNHATNLLHALLYVQRPDCLVLHQQLLLRCLELQADWSRGTCLSSSSALEHSGIDHTSCWYSLSWSFYCRAMRTLICFEIWLFLSVDLNCPVTMQPSPENILL